MKNFKDHFYLDKLFKADITCLWYQRLKNGDNSAKAYGSYNAQAGHSLTIRKVYGNHNL
jgi:hypothetical protein